MNSLVAAEWRRGTTVKCDISGFIFNEGIFVGRWLNFYMWIQMRIQMITFTSSVAQTSSQKSRACATSWLSEAMVLKSHTSWTQLTCDGDVTCPSAFRRPAALDSPYWPVSWPAASSQKYMNGLHSGRSVCDDSFAPIYRLPVSGDSK